MAFARNFRPGYRDDRHEVIQADKIVGICRVQRELGNDRRRGDHEVRRPAARLPADGDHGCRHPAIGPGGVCVEGDRVELVLSPLQGIEPTSPLGGLEVSMQQYGLLYPSLSDPGDLIAAEFDRLVPISAFPSTLVISPDGRIAGRVIGAASVQDLRRLIKAALPPSSS